MIIGRFFICFPVLLIAGCFGPTIDTDPEPKKFYTTELPNSGLSAFRSYPNPHDVCKVFREYTDIHDPIDNRRTLLIACPEHEQSIIEDRVNEGARIIARTPHWTVLHVAISP